MALVYLGLGTNLGDKHKNIADAMVAISTSVGVVLLQSSFCVSKPWGFDSENEFLNVVLMVETKLLPFELLAKTQEIERSLGRTAKSTHGYTDRLIDIDILLYDNQLIDQPTLKIPHPLITERDFVLVPLVEIAPDLVNPLTGIIYSEIIFQG